MSCEGDKGEQSMMEKLELERLCDVDGKWCSKKTKEFVGRSLMKDIQTEMMKPVSLHTLW